MNNILTKYIKYILISLNFFSEAIISCEWIFSLIKNLFTDIIDFQIDHFCIYSTSIVVIIH